MAKKLGDRVSIRGIEFKNRICAGPMGNSTATGDDGIVNAAMLRHFREVAEGGCALIMQGAASVTYENKGHLTQTGIWSDEHIEGLSRIVSDVHERDCRIILQLEHAGIRAVADVPMAPSPFLLKARGVEKQCRAMTKQDIDDVRRLYADAVRRAVAAGYDGVELHAGHGWLLSTFLSPCINLRDDEYGRDRLLLLREIFSEIRALAPDDFIIGIRLGLYNPDLNTGLEHSRQVQDMGFDYINVSNNPVTAWLPQYMDVPEGYGFSAHTYSVAATKKAVDIAVLGGKDIRTAAEAEAVFAETDMDMVLLGRGTLADPQWANKALSGVEPVVCRHCKGRCSWALGGKNCPARAAAAGANT